MKFETQKGSNHMNLIKQRRELEHTYDIAVHESESEAKMGKYVVQVGPRRSNPL